MKTALKKFEVWLADLNPPEGTEPGKVRPVVIIQTDLLNNFHPSTLICPVTTKIIKEAEILRVNLGVNEGGSRKRSSVLVDQIRAIDNNRLIKKIGSLKKNSKDKLKENIKIILDLD